MILEEIRMNERVTVNRTRRVSPSTSLRRDLTRREDRREDRITPQELLVVSRISVCAPRRRVYVHATPHARRYFGSP